MSFIKYSEVRDNWNKDNLNSNGAYSAYFEGKLKNLQSIENVSALDSMKKAKEWAQMINGKEVVINEQDIAQAATSKITGYAENIATVYQETIKAVKSAQNIVSETYRSAAAEILKGIQSGQFKGMSFTIDLNGSTALDLKEAVKELPIKIRGDISNTLGDVGEGVSALAGRAIADSLIESFEKQLNSNNIIDKNSIKATYINKGSTFIQSYRSQTDNELQISFKLNPEYDKMNVGELHFSYNISDKANSALAKLTKNPKSTKNIKIRNSKVSYLLNELQDGEDQVYNTISYHKNLNNVLYPGMDSKAGEALRAYAGYKLLLDTFLKSKKYNDEINFTVYGNKIIPENTIVQQMLEKTITQNLKTGGTRGGKYRYLADIRYQMLVSRKSGSLKSNVRSIQEAESLIRSMTVQIGSTFQI